MIELRTFRPQTGLWEHFHPNTFVMSPLNKQITQRHTTHVNYRNSYMKVDDRLIVKQIVYKFLYCEVLLNPFVYKRHENNVFFDKGKGKYHSRMCQYCPCLSIYEKV